MNACKYEKVKSFLNINLKFSAGFELQTAKHMKKNYLKNLFICGLLVFNTLSSSAWWSVQKSGFGLFGYKEPQENHWTYTNPEGVKVCAAELLCNGGGFNKCAWSKPLNDCEANGLIVIKQNPTILGEFTDNANNMQLYQICSLVDETIQGGTNSGKIIYDPNVLVVYNMNAVNIITIQVYSKTEAEGLGIWPI